MSTSSIKTSTLDFIVVFLIWCYIVVRITLKREIYLWRCPFWNIYDKFINGLLILITVSLTYFLLLILLIIGFHYLMFRMLIHMIFLYEVKVFTMV